MGGEEVVGETHGVGVQELLDAGGIGGFEDEAGMLIFGDTIGDFGIGVRARVGMFLASEGENHSGVIAAGLWHCVRLFAGGDFEACPFAPEVDAGGGFDNIGDVGAAYAGSDFNEIKFFVGVGFEEFGVGNATEKAESADQVVGSPRESGTETS